MCGIAAAVYFSEPPAQAGALLRKALQTLASRGPDDEGVFEHGNTFLGHRRLSIIDVSEKAHQPFSDSSGRYTIIFNGEIFNFRELRALLEKQGITFRSNSDTEVLLELFIREGLSCLPKLNGFFAFAVHDQSSGEVTIVRDRYGIKPLYYFTDTTRFLFASEVKALTAMGIPLELDRTTLHLYLQLNYVPGPWSMLQHVKQVPPGHYITVRDRQIKLQKWYELPTTEHHEMAYEEACKLLYEKLSASVSRRLISDVPLGAFLSGGVDSSVIVALAAKETKGLHTFSIGYADEPSFDETRFARKVAAHCGTNHREFLLKSSNLMAALLEVLDYFGEPFADSSALAVYILSKETRKQVTVSLSGDGSDELFGGYNKHRAEWIMRKYGWMGVLTRTTSPLLASFRGSRQSRHGNLIRQLHRFAEGAGMDAGERYWRWCSITTFGHASALLYDYNENATSLDRIQSLTSEIRTNNFNEILRNDLRLVLPYDMLTKVDLMSMANSLEVRTPFLDVEVVEAALSFPVHFKINKKQQKRILADSFGHLLPEEVFTRRKQGFEVPLLRWLQTDLKPMLDDYLSPALIEEQKIFNLQEVNRLRKSIESNGSGEGETAARLWALLVFQHWWIKNFAQ
jgi:asparagine synthase (glutamine-hydrolysing)